MSGAGALAGAALAAPEKSGAFTGTLRVITLGVEWPTPEVQKKAEADLGFKFALTVTDPVTMVQKAITAPETFDVFGGYNYQYIQMCASHHLLPVDTQEAHGLAAALQAVRVRQGASRRQGGDLRRRRRSVPGALPQAGHDRAAAVRKDGPRSNKDIVQWVDERGDQQDDGPDASVDRRSAGALQRRLDRLQRRRAQEAAESGRLAGAPEQAVEGQGRAAQGPRHRHAGRRQRAQGPRHLQAEGHGQHDEGRDRQVVKIATTYKKAGQFRAYWANFNESVNLMASKEVVVESMWSPAVALLGRPGHQRQVRGAARRASAAGAALRASRRTSRPIPAKLQACYDYINWMYDGLARRDDHAPGLLHRQRGHAQGVDRKNGAANPAGGIPFKTDEYDFWYDGARAGRDLPGITGKVGDIKKGSVRDGGSFATAHRPLLVLELATSRTARTRSSGGTTSSAPRTEWLRGTQSRTRRGRHRPPPPLLRAQGSI